MGIKWLTLQPSRRRAAARAVPETSEASAGTIDPSPGNSKASCPSLLNTPQQHPFCQTSLSLSAQSSVESVTWCSDIQTFISSYSGQKIHSFLEKGSSRKMDINNWTRKQSTGTDFDAHGYFVRQWKESFILVRLHIIVVHLYKGHVQFLLHLSSFLPDAIFTNQKLGPLWFSQASQNSGFSCVLCHKTWKMKSSLSPAYMPFMSCKHKST